MEQVNEKKILIEDMYVCWGDFYYYDDYVEEYEYTSDVVLLKKSDYNFSINGENKIKSYINCFNEQIKYFVGEEGKIKRFSYNAREQIQWFPYQFSDIISFKDLIKKFETDKRIDSKYREYVLDIYGTIVESIDNQDSILLEDLAYMIGHIYDLYVYTFGKMTEEEYDRDFAPGHNVLDFEKYKNMLRKKDKK